MSPAIKILRLSIKLLLICGIFLLLAVFIFLSCSTSVTRNIDEHVYELPFEKGKQFKVVQGYGGLFSHQYAASLDFEMPVGTKVYASRDGIVYSYRDNNDEGGISGKYKGKANYIIIKHSDGSFGCYWHLSKNGVLIKKGPVRAGQAIGISGATGQVFRPHLHFSVKRRLSYDEESYIRTRFRTSKGVLLAERGGLYKRPED